MRSFRSTLTGSLAVVLALASLTACATKSSYDTAVARGDSLQTENTQLQAENAKLQAQQDSLEVLFAAEIAAAAVDLDLLRDGIEIQIPSDLHFESGSLKMSADGRAFGTKLVNYLQGNQFLIFVTGYTDSQKPTGTLAQEYPTNWELSSARADLAVRYMIGEGIAANRLWAIGRADNDPIASNSTAEGRAKNRRLRIVLRPPSLVVSSP